MKTSYFDLHSDLDGPIYFRNILVVCDALQVETFLL